MTSPPPETPGAVALPPDDAGKVPRCSTEPAPAATPPRPAQPLAPPAACANCGAVLPVEPPPAFCPQCGQEAKLHPPSAGEFLHEFVGHYFALEGALWRTLKLLFGRPGQLTREYLEGRRRRYVLPLRLYISASFLFFVVVKLMGLGTGPFIDLGLDTSAIDGTERTRLESCAQGANCGDLDSWVAAQVLRAEEQGMDNRRLGERLMGMAPYAVFAMQPVFAALVAVAYRRRRMPYGAHFVFSLHLHSLWFVGLLAIALLPDGPGNLLLLPMALYAAMAMHRVYGGRVGVTALRATGVAMVYVTLLVTTILALALLALALI